MTETVFTAQALTKAFTSGEVQVLALQGVDLEVSAGEVVVLLRTSARGKSPLLEHHGRPRSMPRGRLFLRDLKLTDVDGTP